MHACCFVLCLSPSGSQSTDKLHGHGRSSVYIHPYTTTVTAAGWWWWLCCVLRLDFLWFFHACAHQALLIYTLFFSLSLAKRAPMYTCWCTCVCFWSVSLFVVSSLFVCLCCLSYSAATSYLIRLFSEAAGARYSVCMFEVLGRSGM